MHCSYPSLVISVVFKVRLRLAMECFPEGRPLCRGEEYDYDGGAAYYCVVCDVEAGLSEYVQVGPVDGSVRGTVG